MSGGLRCWLAEALGTAGLLAAVVGSGIAVAHDGSASGALFQHAVVVGLALVALILAFGPVSGAHLNPAVTLANAWFGGVTWPQAASYVSAQLIGAVGGTVFTAVTFGLPVVELAATARAGWGNVAAEAAATAGLLVVIFGLVRSGGGRVVALAVGAYITAAIAFTASASFANPAVTIARVLTDTYTGIRPVDVPGFLLGQLIGAAVGVVVISFLYDPRPAEAADVVVPHHPHTDEPRPTDVTHR